MSIWSLLERAVALYPSEPAVYDRGRWWSYSEVFHRAASIARFFKANGVAHGDRISILDTNSLAYFECYFAVAALGAVLNPLNFRLSAKEITAVLDDAGSRWLILSSDFTQLVEQLELERTSLRGIVCVGEEEPQITLPITNYEQQVLEEGGPFTPNRVLGKDTAQLYFTSGTTGRPRGVMLSHDNVCFHALAAIAELQLTAEDTWGHFAPMFHLADAWATFAVTWVGGRHVIAPRFQARSVAELIQSRGVTITNLIPTMLNSMVNDPEVSRSSFPSLRRLLSGGAPISPTLVSRILEVFGCEYIQTYGMTETSPYLTMSLLKPELKKRSVEEQLEYSAKTGRPFLGVSLKVVDSTGRSIADDGKEVGEIWVRGPSVFSGYWNLPEETRAAFVDGWFQTGDLATLDKEGYIDIVDRKKDMIITGGENVYTTEVENVLYKHASILEACVFGVPDAEWGECVVAAVVLQHGEELTAKDIREHCRTELAGYKSPKFVEFLDELPRTGSGKIYRSALRDRFIKND